MADKAQETTQTQETPKTETPKKGKGTFKKVLKYCGLVLAGAALGAGGTVLTEKFLIKGKKKNA